MSTACAHDGCECTPTIDSMWQFRCDSCGIYTQPVQSGHTLTDSTPSSYVDGCWVRTGVTCPDCQES